MVQAPVKIFVVYANEDKPVRDKLLRQLRPLADKGVIDLWSDQEIKPGARWDEEIRQRLTESEIILLLVSDDFFASGYIRRVEFETALELQARGQARILPVIARHCGWADLPALSLLQVLPPEGRPVLSKEWDSPDEPYLKIYEGVKTAVREVRREAIAQKPTEEMRRLPAKVSRNWRLLAFGVVLILVVAAGVWKAMFGSPYNQIMPVPQTLPRPNSEAIKLDTPRANIKTVPLPDILKDKRPKPGDSNVTTKPKPPNKTPADSTKTEQPPFLPKTEQVKTGFDHQDEPVEDMSRILKDHKFGFLNVITGQIIGWYDDAENFQKGRGAYVKQNGHYFWIDKTGRCIENCQ